MIYPEFVVADIVMPVGLSELAEQCFNLDEDYGYVFYKPDNGRVIVSIGDCFDHEDEITEKFDMIDGVEHVSFELESYAPQDSGWYIMLPSDDGWQPAYWSESAETYLPLK